MIEKKKVGIRHYEQVRDSMTDRVPIDASLEDSDDVEEVDDEELGDDAE